MKTAGHLASNGGVRGHSAGDTFPFIVIRKGEKWRIQNPDGSLRDDSYHSVKVIYPLARQVHAKWLETGEY